MTTKMTKTFGFAGLFMLLSFAAIGCAQQPPSGKQVGSYLLSIPELPVTIENPWTTMTIHDLSIDGGDNSKFAVAPGETLPVKIDYSVLLNAEIENGGSVQPCGLAYNEQILIGFGSDDPQACIYDEFWGRGTGGETVSGHCPLNCYLGWKPPWSPGKPQK